MESKLLFDLALILLATKIFGLLMRRLHLPQVVGALLVGIVFGPALLGFIEINEVITVVAELGVLLLLFEAGLETDFARLRQSLKSVLLIALCGVTVPFIGGFTLSYCFGRNIMESVFVGVIVMSSSIGITVEALHEMGKIDSKAGTLIVGAAVIDDIVGIVMISIVVGMGEGSVSVIQVGSTLLMTLVFFLFAALCGFVAFKAFEIGSTKWGMKKRLSIFGLAFCFLMAYIADRFGLASIVGAYFAGLVLCNSKAEKFIEEKSTVLSFMFFSPVFFASIGLMMNVVQISGREALFALLLAVVAICSKLVGCGLGAKLCKATNREAVQVGAGMVAQLEMPIVAAVIGMELGYVNDAIFSAVVVMVISTTLIAPILLKLSFREKVKTVV